MREQWTGDLIGRMHNEHITRGEMARELGIGKAYMSMILSGKRKPKDIQVRMQEAMTAILIRRMKEEET